MMAFAIVMVGASAQAGDAVSDAGNELVQLIREQKTIDLWGDQRAYVTYESAEANGCQFRFRDQIKLYASSTGQWVTYVTTRSFDFFKMSSLRKRQDEAVYQLDIGGGFESVINHEIWKIIDDGDPEMLDAYATSEAYLRFDRDKRAQRAATLIETLIKLCQK